jgi:hypothetical protein
VTTSGGGIPQRKTPACSMPAFFFGIGLKLFPLHARGAQRT